MSNYKAETTALELKQELSQRTGLPCTFEFLSGIPTLHLGLDSLKTGGGLCIQILDRRGSTSGGWFSLPGFGSVAQDVYVLGVAKVITEALVDVSVASAFATGIYTATGVNVDTQTVTINGVVLTSRTTPLVESDYALGTDATTAAVALKNCINNHSQLKLLLVASNVAGAVTVTAKIPGAAANAITTTETQTNGAWGGGQLTGGAGASQGYVCGADIFQEVDAALAKRGMKIEVWQTPVGTPPVTSGSLNTSYLQSEFWPNITWTINDLA